MFSIMKMADDIYQGRAQTFWQSTRSRYENEESLGVLDDKKRMEYERILSTEGQVSYRLNERGWPIIQSSLSNFSLEWEVSLAMYDYDKHVRWLLECRAEDNLEEMQTVFDKLKDRMRVSHPELVDKKFGFVINAIGYLEATHTEELSDREKNQLDGWLNDIDSLKEKIVDHAKLVLALCKTDTGMRDSLRREKPDLTRYSDMVTLKNIHQFIDYGLLLHNPRSKEGQGYSWTEQLISNAERKLEEAAKAEAEKNK